MKHDINQMAFAAKKDETVREQLLRSQERIILRIASLTTFRFVTKSDDEWSVALCAFSDAIDHYSPAKGDFLPFARVAIKHALIDWHRSPASGRWNEVSVSPFVLEGQIDDTARETEKAAYLAMAEQSAEERGESLRDEVEAANQELEQYGFRFFDLRACSPRQERSRRQCAKAVRYLLARPELLSELKRSKRLPIQELEKGTGIRRKLLEQYRRYVIMAVVILTGDYPHIAEHLKDIREEVQP